MTPIAPLITSFLREHMPIEQGCSPHTCETYAHAFRLLFVFASKRLGIKPSQICIEQIDAALILDFLAHIEEQRGNCAATRNGRLAAVKAFIRYVEFRVPSALAQARQIHAIPSKRHDQALVRHLTMDEVRAILNAPNTTTRLGIRDRAMLHLCFAGGLRVSELGGAPAGERDPATNTEHSCSRQGPEGTMPSALEGNCDRSPCLVGGSRSAACARVIRERRGSCNDPGRLRVHSRQTRLLLQGRVARL